MGSNEEITRVQSWIADWYEVPVESCKFSREDIRDICRGPMREVLLDFILPRFRTNEQIKVIRNNLYLMDVLKNKNEEEGFQKGSDSQDRKLTDLKKRTEEMQQDNVESIKQISKGFRRIMETELELQRNLVENLVHFKNLDAYVQFLRGRVTATSVLLEDMHQIKHSNGRPNSFPQSPSTVTESNPMESSSPQLLHLKSLYNSTSLLFNKYFIQNSNSPDVQTLSSSVAAQSAELVQLGISPGDVEKWTKREQEKFSQQLKNATMKYSNVMNPVETLSNEAETLHVKLMKAHVDLHFQNIELQRISRNLSDQLSEKIKNAVFNDANIVPTNLVNSVQKEERQAKLYKCRELATKLKKVEIRNCDEDQDLLTLICSEVNCYEESRQKTTNLCPDNETSSLSTSRLNTKPDINCNTLKQEVLEDLTCALLKSCPASRSQLETTIKQCKSLILERFPKLFLRDENSDSNQVTNSPGKLRESTTELLDINIQVPLKFLPNHDILSVPSVSVTSEQNDWLEDILRMQSEVEKMRRQNEEIYSKRDINTF